MILEEIAKVVKLKGNGNVRFEKFGEEVLICESEVPRLIAELDYQRYLVGERTFKGEVRSLVLTVLRKNGQFYFRDLEKRIDVAYVLPREMWGLFEPGENSGLKLVSCKNYVHPMDPLFFEIEGIKPENNREYVAVFEKEGEEYRVRKHAFDRFVERFGDEKIRMQRDKLIVMYRYFVGAEEVERGNRVSQLVKHKCEEAKYFTMKGWIFVVELKGNIIGTCYKKGETASVYRRISRK